MSSSSTFSNNTSSTPYHITNPTSTNTQKSFSTPSTLSSSFQNSTTNSSYANPAWMNDPIYAAYCAQYYANLESTVVPPLSTAPSSSSIPNPASSLVSPTTRLPEDLGVGTLPLHSTPSLSASNPFLPQPLSSSIASDIPDLSNVILKTESKRKHTSSHPQLPSTSLSTTSSSHTTPSSSSSHPSSSQKKSGLSHSSESTSETSLKRKRKEGGDEENSKKESSHGPQKPKRMIRSAAGQIWEDKSLEDWPECTHSSKLYSLFLSPFFFFFFFFLEVLAQSILQSSSNVKIFRALFF
ncbi:hypothetical protein HMI56_003716 [Coelomomyces lativittatus]|nr:hypothetical protein HMI56_003716 [Coelomomyces lativittatus]